jgi:hypothetical protein
MPVSSAEPNSEGESYMKKGEKNGIVNDAGAQGLSRSLARSLAFPLLRVFLGG